ncbi:glycosyltransferase family 2 protein [bacterium]|nr:glycosyltransferase family 2 protein [bacterium]
MKLKSLSGVLLAYHEEGVIEKSIRALQAVMEQVAEKSEVIVVGYEGCKDSTNEIVKKIACHNPDVKLVIQKTSEKGYGRAFYLGIRAASNEWVFQTDADGQYQIEDLKRLVALADENTDLIHGYRKKRNDPFERVVMAFCYNMALKLLFWIPIRDVDSAFKLMRASKVQALPVKSLSGFSVAELIIRLKRCGSRFRQIDITHLPRTEGEALSEKGVKNPFNLQIPNLNLVSGTLGEMIKFRFAQNKNLERPCS